MTQIHLEDNEWQQVIQILSTAPWNIANPLLLKIGNQIRAQATGERAPSPPIKPLGELLNSRKRNSGEKDAAAPS